LEDLYGKVILKLKSDKTINNTYVELSKNDFSVIEWFMDNKSYSNGKMSTYDTSLDLSSATKLSFTISLKDPNATAFIEQRSASADIIAVTGVNTSTTGTNKYSPANSNVNTNVHFELGLEYTL